MVSIKPYEPQTLQWGELLSWDGLSGVEQGAILGADGEAGTWIRGDL